MHVFVTTFNVAMLGHKLKDGDLRDWLSPAFQDGDAAPDLVAIGLQEVIELPAALTGLVGPTLNTLTSRIAQTLTTLSSAAPSASTTPSAYIPLSLVHHCNVSLHVFYRESTLAGRIGKAVTSTVGLGGIGKRSLGRVLRLGNKSGVGIRVPVQRHEPGEEEIWESFTFVNAHLAPHEQNIHLRNSNYLSIVSSLLFTPSSVLDLPHTIYDTSHCFFMGDLNYRLTSLPPQGWDLNTGYLASASSGEERDPALVEERKTLVGMETLKQEQGKGRTMLGFKEGRLEAFPPSFKRFVGRVDGYHKKRVPGWTDRIFWASISDTMAEGQEQDDTVGSSSQSAEKAPKKAARTGILEYGSLDDVTVSDHKPVYASFATRVTTSGGSSQHTTPQIALPSTTSLPGREDVNVIALRSAVGQAIDRILGFHWLLLVTPAKFAQYSRSHPALIIVLAVEIATVLLTAAAALGYRPII